MKRLAVNIPPEVEQQILQQVLYIAEDSIDNALAWEARLREAIVAIGDVPGHAVDEEASRRLGGTIRTVAFEGTYLIHYRVNDAAGVVQIINFRHVARLPRTAEP